MPDLNLVDEKFAKACDSYVKQDYVTAIHICRRLVLDSPNFSKSYHMLGLIYLQQENFLRAINYLIRAMAFAEFDLEIIYNLACSYHKNQQRDLAIQYYQKVLFHCPEHKAARFNLACALNETGQNHAAIFEYQQVVYGDHGHICALYNIAKSYQGLNKFNKAIKFYQAILELDSNNASIFNNLGICFRAINKIDKAYACFLEALDKDKDNATAYNNLGEICVLENKFSLAVKFFRKAIKHSIKYKSAWLNLAMVYRLIYDFENAIKCYNKISFYYPQDPEIQYFIWVCGSKNKTSKILSAPLEYIKKLYDLCSHNYTRYISKQQKYKVPQIFKQILKEHKIMQVNRALDIGCGTGLVAAELKSTVRFLQLVGVDVSHNMLDIAKKSYLYTDLYLDNVDNYLLKKTKKYDLILAADVLVFQGCLKNTFKQIANCMHDKSKFLVSLEMSTSQSYAVKHTGRFGHSLDYINRITAENNLKITKYVIIIVRQEAGIPIPGYCLLLEKK
jgi:predicted TPR repeat methyltransferase